MFVCLRLCLSIAVYKQFVLVFFFTRIAIHEILEFDIFPIFLTDRVTEIFKDFLLTKYLSPTILKTMLQGRIFMQI